jgi:FAS-associated factor 2
MNTQSTAARNNASAGSAIERWLAIVAQILRIVLWPLRRFSTALFPSQDFDGLSSAVTAKAAQQFVTYLTSVQEARRKQQLQSAETAASPPLLVSQVWQATGFTALREQAVQNHALVLIYLHSPLHRASASVCQQVLTNEAFLEYLSDAHVLGMGVSVHTALGQHLQQVLQATALPCLALLEPGDSSTLQMLFRAQGPALLDMLKLDTTAASTTNNRAVEQQLLPFLRAALHHHQNVVAEQTVRRLQREEETELRRSQDEEYQVALAADQERERQVQEERLVKEREQREVEEQEAAKVTAKEEALCVAMSLVLPEPAQGTPNISTVRFVLPSGAKLNRRFGSDETIGALRAFLFLHFQEKNMPMTNIGLSTNFPKHSYNDKDGQTLREAGLTPQAVLMVQDLDA